ncbi:MAG: DUF3795 domain-containing protein [Spirochaetales bacterium]|nr:DUF3795 domain-containing protein [Spirochaetales bacterium]
MTNMTAACGLNCATCPGHIAWKTDDEELRQKTAAQWKVVHNADFAPQDVNCVGCMTASEGPRIAHCSACSFRQCARDKNLAHCRECTQYPCETLSQFHSQVPHAKAGLDALSNT